MIMQWIPYMRFILHLDQNSTKKDLVDVIGYLIQSIELSSFAICHLPFDNLVISNSSIISISPKLVKIMERKNCI